MKSILVLLHNIVMESIYLYYVSLENFVRILQNNIYPMCYPLWRIVGVFLMLDQSEIQVVHKSF